MNHGGITQGIIIVIRAKPAQPVTIPVNSGMRKRKQECSWRRWRYNCGNQNRTRWYCFNKEFSELSRQDKTRQDKTRQEKGSETEAERRSRKQTKKSSIGKQPILLWFILCTGVWSGVRIVCGAPLCHSVEMASQIADKCPPLPPHQSDLPRCSSG